ncbi:hypothetical protein C2L64_44970 [Paraburkholderia hospita]|uniref:Uncharacterized protein n=1 Tax=Paraburkholderia hospita TaxID=169430 RepID=A0AAN1MQ91_9BURK|nr:hypothetical protein [Paraburkholderia hospita]AUT75535.1 hypothetical protein C2L64_44970 [Paraburkholderia hospita]
MSDNEEASSSRPASDSGGSVNPGPELDTAALLQAFTGGTADPMSLLMSQFGGAAAEDPKLGMLMQLLTQRSTDTVENVQNDEAQNVESGPKEPVVTRSECARRMRELSDTAKQIYAELEILRERNDALAAAVGACFLCFGTDSLCEECGGRGVPGSRMPEPAAYRLYVMPAMRRAQRPKRTYASTTPSNDRRGTTSTTTRNEHEEI